MRDIPSYFHRCMHAFALGSSISFVYRVCINRFLSKANGHLYHSLLDL